MVAALKRKKVSKIIGSAKRKKEKEKHVTPSVMSHSLQLYVLVTNKMKIIIICAIKTVMRIK